MGEIVEENIKATEKYHIKTKTLWRRLRENVLPSTPEITFEIFFNLARS